MIRISETNLTDHNVLLQVEGRLIGRDVEELSLLCFDLLARHRSIRLDLEGLRFADREGIKLLRQLKESCADIRGCSLFLEAELNS